MFSLAAQVQVRRLDKIQDSTSARSYFTARPILKNAGPEPSQRFFASDERDKPVRSATCSKDKRFKGDSR
ncbi:hypothetical protein ASC80_05715 [Afipia sp. Root123D2]|nr:hypothetical protein ASC80_05715 [Afipia sp. Root123D2]